jgi:hypothetical protein
MPNFSLILLTIGQSKTKQNKNKQNTSKKWGGTFCGIALCSEMPKSFEQIKSRPFKQDSKLK